MSMSDQKRPLPVGSEKTTSPRDPMAAPSIAAASAPLGHGPMALGGWIGALMDELEDARTPRA